MAGDPLRQLPLAAFRVEFMGSNFGVPCEFLVYEKPPKWTFDHALAFTLLHDVRVRPGGVNATLERMSPIWEVQRRFGVQNAEWHPYWSNTGLVKAQPTSVFVSLYLRRATGTRGPGTLLVISNLSAREAVEAQVVLDLAAMGLTDDLKATDALTGEHLTLGGGKLALPVAPVRMRMVEVQAEAGKPQ